jgi:glycosyltransferase involved in cell wall biosynthesis
MMAGTPRRIRVLHVTPFLEMGGAARLVLDMVHFLASNEAVEVRLCVLGKDHCFFQTGMLSTPPVFLNYSGRYRRPMETRRCVLALKSLIEEFKPDIVHSTLWLADQVSAWALAGNPNVRQVIHILDTRPWLASSRPTSWLRRILFKTSTRRAAFIASSFVARDYTCDHLGMPRENMPVIYNGIDLGDFPPTSHRTTSTDEVIIGAAGRFDPEKGHNVLIRAAAELHAKGYAFRLRIAGSGPLEPAYLRLTSELGIADRLELPGRVKDIAEFYRGLDIFVMPSLFAEGLPLALLGAMATELPVVSTTGTAGATEVIRNGVDGLLVPAGNAGALTAAIEGLLHDSALRRSMGEKARVRVREAFTVQAMTHKVARVYRELTSTDGSK